MLGLTNRPFSASVHTLNLSIANKPGTLARVLVALTHNNINVENIRIDPIDGTDWSDGLVTVTCSKAALGNIERQLTDLSGVRSLELIPSAFADDLLLDHHLGPASLHR